MDEIVLKCIQGVVKYVNILLVLFQVNTFNQVAHYITIKIRWKIPPHRTSEVWYSSLF